MVIGEIAYRPNKLVTQTAQLARAGRHDDEPLILFLACSHIERTGTWPSQRCRLFEDYSEAAFHRAMIDEHCQAEQSEKPHDAGRARWRSTTSQPRARAHAATSLSYAPLCKDIDVDRGVEIGRSCGILLPEPEDEATVRFAHHRMQKYFTARHVHQQHPPTDWKANIDVPRWQEILLNVVSLQGDGGVRAAVGGGACLGAAGKPRRLSSAPA